MAREQRLLAWGEEFFLAQGESEQIMESAEQRITEIRAKAEQEAARASASQARVVAAMKEERIGLTEIAQRLELSVSEVRALLKGSLAPRSSDAIDDSAGIEVADESDQTTQHAPVGV
ncbi:hypothetical protein [Kocuria turfanensis]|nr:hypothetical protein [Kocuria turfanensis]